MLLKSPQYYLFECYQQDFLLYERMLNQQFNDTNKVYSLHEPPVTVAKGKDRELYEYGKKVLIACTARSNVIVGVVSHEQSMHDNRTFPEILKHIEASRGKAASQAVCDRSYRGQSEVNGAVIILTC